MPDRRAVERPPSEQRCLRCGHALPELDPRTDCPRCGSLLELVHPPPPFVGDALRDSFRTSTCASGVWRYQSLVLPSAIDRVSFPEGNTPLLDRARVTRWCGTRWLRLKHEGMNPTGSFKDRGMTVGMTQARRVGATAAVCASTGNTAASLAAYAALAGLPALVLLPAGKIAQGKLTQSVAYGALTLAVRGDFDVCLRLARQAASELGVYLLNSVNPFRIEGQKTIVLELLEQLGWEAPDWIAVPAGNLGNTAAFGKALREALSFGLIDRMPRLLAVQAAGAAPFAQSYREEFRVRHRVKANTIATAINIGDPASYDRAERAIRETNGIVTDVTDEEIMESKSVVDSAGVGCEPASAASVAGVRKLVAAGTILPGERVVAVLTGHVLKDPDLVWDTPVGGQPGIRRSDRLREIDATLTAIGAELERERSNQ